MTSDNRERLKDVLEELKTAHALIEERGWWPEAIEVGQCWHELVAWMNKHLPPERG